MKKKTTIFMAIFITTFSYAQRISEKNIPSEVKRTFQKQYPGTKAKWDEENGNYEASFSLNKKDHSVLYDKKGNEQENEVEIEMNELPREILTYLKEHYKGQKIKEVAKITNSKGISTFEVEIRGKDLIFGSDGNFLKN
jgi:hypothetical protein